MAGVVNAPAVIVTVPWSVTVVPPDASTPPLRVAPDTLGLKEATLKSTVSNVVARVPSVMLLPALPAFRATR